MRSVPLALTFFGLAQAQDISFLYHDIGLATSNQASEFTPQITDSNTLLLNDGQPYTLYDLCYKEIEFKSLAKLKIDLDLDAGLGGIYIMFYMDSQDLPFMDNLIPGGIGMAVEYSNEDAHSKGVFVISPDGTFQSMAPVESNHNRHIEISFDTTDEYTTSTVVLSTSGVEVEVQPELFVIQNIYSTESFYTTATVIPVSNVISHTVETHTIYDTESTSITQSTTTTFGVLKQVTDTIITTAAVTDISYTIQTAYATIAVNGVPKKSSSILGIIIGASVGGAAALGATAFLIYSNVASNPIVNAVAFVEGTEMITDNPLYQNSIHFHTNELYSIDLAHEIS